MSLRLLPDTLIVLSDYLRGVPEVAALVGDRVGLISPQEVDRPWVRLTRIGGSNAAWMALDTANVQLDIFAPPNVGDSRLVAWTLARTVYAALHQAVGWANDDAVIAQVADVAGLSWQPDTTRTPPFPRVLLTVAVTTRAIT